MSSTCSDCFYVKRIHPVKPYTDEFKNQFGGMRAECTLKHEIVGEEFDVCERFKSFVGWAYR